MSSIKSKIESLLFISAKPMALKQLCALLKKSEDDIKAAGDDLVESYKNNEAGIRIIKDGKKYQMVSSPENSNLVREFVNDEATGELSRPSLETLTIIAYRGPIAKLEIEKIRGVNCSIILRNLLLRGLVESKMGKNEDEIFFSVSFDFIRFLGVNDISELPEYEKLNGDKSIDDILGKEAEDDKKSEDK